MWELMSIVVIDEKTWSPARNCYQNEVAVEERKSVKLKNIPWREG